MPTVQLPDGTTALFPDNMAPADIQSAIAAHIGGQPAPTSSSTLPQMSAAPPRTVQDVLADFEHDLKEGGARTAMGRLLGKMQGRGDAGYTGLSSGVSPGVANFMGSPELGVTHALQGIQQIPFHPVDGTIKAASGALEAATIPSMMIGGPAADAAITSIPSKLHAGQVLEGVRDAAKGVPVSLSNAMTPLERTQQLASAGAAPARVADLLYQRSKSIVPLTYEEARDFYSNLARLSQQERLALNPPMQAALNALKTAFHGDITEAAATVGKGEEYANAIKEYAKASKMGQAAKALGKAALGTAAGGYLYNQGSKYLGALSGK